MAKLAVFLRGINVNGRMIKMDELRSVIQMLPYRDVRTVLASGNVLVTTDDEHPSLAEHQDAIAAKLSTFFGYDATVVVKSAAQIQAILTEAAGHIVPDGYHHYILLSQDDLPGQNNRLGEQLAVMFERCQKIGFERLILDQQGIYWLVPKGDTLHSEFGQKVLGQKAFRNVLTSRTVQTIQRVAVLL